MYHLREKICFATKLLIALGVTACGSTTEFAVVGDFGKAGETAETVAALVKSWNPSFIVTTGDNNYPDGGSDTIDVNIGQYYSDFIQDYIGNYGKGAIEQRFFPTMGNHDWDAPDGATPYLDYFHLPHNERYYTVLRHPVHLFILDSDSREPDGNISGSTQGEWLKNELNRSSAPWKIIFLHHPPYSSSDRHGSTPESQWPFRAWGASLVVSGHDHAYERLEKDGLTYIVNGVGGNPDLYTANSLLPESRHYHSGHGAMKIVASSSTLKVDFITIYNEVNDSFQLSL